MPDLVAEALVAARFEQARSVADVLLRRTRLGLLAARSLTADKKPARRVAAAMASELGWGRRQVGKEVDAWLDIAEAEGLVVGERACRSPRRWRPTLRYLETVTPQVIEACDRRLELGARPLLMGILNATPDSFYDGGRFRDLEAQALRAHELLDEGADLIDVGGQSAVTNRPAVAVAEEIERVVPLVERIAALGAVVSVDTYRAEVAKAAIDAGAVMVNDPSGMSDPGLARVCASEGAALVVTHTRAQPKQKLREPRYADIVEDVKRFLHGRAEQARAAGVEETPVARMPGAGPRQGARPDDRSASPARGTERAGATDPAVGLPQGLRRALLRRAPSERLAGTLAAIAHGVARGARVLRVHDVAETRDFLTVSAALNGELEPPSALRLA